MIVKITHMVFCSECKECIGVFDNTPLCVSAFEPILNMNQSYIYEVFKERDKRAMTYYYIEAFCKKECKESFLKKYYKIGKKWKKR